MLTGCLSPHHSCSPKLWYKIVIPKCRDSNPNTTACPIDPEPQSSPAWDHQSLPQRCWRMLVCPGSPHGCPAPMLGWCSGFHALTLLPASRWTPPESPAPFASQYPLSRWGVHVRSTNSHYRSLGTQTLSLVVYIQHSDFRSPWLPKVLLKNAGRNFPPPSKCQNLAAFKIGYQLFPLKARCLPHNL